MNPETAFQLKLLRTGSLASPVWKRNATEATQGSAMCFQRSPSSSAQIYPLVPEVLRLTAAFRCAGLIVLLRVFTMAMDARAPETSRRLFAVGQYVTKTLALAELH